MIAPERNNRTCQDFGLFSPLQPSPEENCLDQGRLDRFRHRIEALEAAIKLGRQRRDQLLAEIQQLSNDLETYDALPPSETRDKLILETRRKIKKACTAYENKTETIKREERNVVTYRATLAEKQAELDFARLCSFQMS